MGKQLSARRVLFSFIAGSCLLCGSYGTQAQNDLLFRLRGHCSKHSADGMLKDYRYLSQFRTVDSSQKALRELLVMMDEAERISIAEDSSPKNQAVSSFMRASTYQAARLALEEPGLSDSEATTALYARCRDMVDRSMR